MPDTAWPSTTSVLRFDAGLPGFPEARRFTLLRWGDEDSPFSVLQSLDDDRLQFVVVPPEAYFPDYAPVLNDDDVERLGLEEPEDAIVVVVVSLGERPQDATANLLGPVVINRHTLAAAQVVLTRQDLAPRVPLLAG